MSIAPILPPTAANIETTKVDRAPQTDVGNAFTHALSEARNLESNATEAAQKFANGDQSVGIHEVMITTEKANIAVRYATTLKNKAIEAYRELMNTQV